MTFHWGQWLTGPCYALGDTSVAHLARTDDGWRVVLHPNTPSKLRHEFFPTEGEAKAYVEAWARRWRDELVALYGESD